MSLLYAITWLCDAMLYFGILGWLGMLAGSPSWLFAAPLTLALACAAGFRLRDQGRRWLIPAGAAIALVMALLPRVPDRLICLPPAVYLILYMQANRAVTDHYYAAGRFRRGLLTLPVAGFLAANIASPHWTQGLPCLFAYIALSVFLLRMLRADDSAVRSRKFRLMNLASITVVCAAGFALSQPAALSVLGAIWRFIADRVLAPAASALLYGIGWVIYALAWLLSFLVPDGAFSGEMPQFQAAENLEQVYLAPEEGGLAVNPLARALVIVIGVALLTAIALVLLRLLARQMARAGGTEAADERESLADEEAPPRMPRPRPGGDPGEGVRYWYLRQLRLIRGKGGEVTPAMNTRQIRDANAGRFDPGALDALREVYLPVRYDDRPADPDAARRAKAAYQALRESRGKDV